MCYRALPWSKQVNKCIHLILHGLALVLGAVGISAAFKYHNELGISNLYTLHSWLGLGTISLYAIQVIKKKPSNFTILRSKFLTFFPSLIAVDLGVCCILVPWSFKVTESRLTPLARSLRGLCLFVGDCER